MEVINLGLYNCSTSEYDCNQAPAIEAAYDFVLDCLVDRLNGMHEVQYSRRFWEIVAGSWLIHFVGFYYDFRNRCHPRACFPDGDDLIEDLFVLDTAHFLSKIKTEKYRDAIGLVSSRHKIECLAAARIEVGSICSSTVSLRDYFYDLLSKTLIYLNPSQDAVVIDSLFSRFDKLRYLARRNSIGSLLLSRLIRRPKHDVTVIDVQGRYELFSNLNIEDEFISQLIDVLPYCLPCFFLEHFRANISSVKEIETPKYKHILTSKTHLHNDYLRLWIAVRIDAGASWSIWQHGGFYGSALHNHHEYYERRIACNYLSWGWADTHGFSKDNQLIAFGVPVYWKKVRRPRIATHVTIVVSEFPYGFSRQFMSWPRGEQVMSYFQEIRQLCQQLVNIFGSNLVIRMPDSIGGYGFPARAFFEEVGLQKYFDENIYINNVYDKSRLVIHTTNTTTFLETFFAGVPSLLYLNPNLWQFRRSAITDFLRLYEAKVLHADISSLVEFTEQVYENPTWWFSDKVSSSVDTFMSKYCRARDNTVERLIQINELPRVKSS